LAEKPDPTLYDHLGDIYAAQQQPDKARQAWRKALEIEPNDQIKKKLEQ
jgi:predicted negative regulator of RcsB-dependent stress response